jgi:hypothetical protein
MYILGNKKWGATNQIWCYHSFLPLDKRKISLSFHDIKRFLAMVVAFKLLIGCMGNGKFSIFPIKKIGCHYFWLALIIALLSKNNTLPTYLPTFLPTYLPSYLLTYLLSWSHSISKCVRRSRVGTHILDNGKKTNNSSSNQ